MVEAELMIVPDLAMADLKRSMANLDRAMKASAKKAGDEFKDEMEKGMVAGAKRGAARMGGALKRNAGGIAGGIAGVLAAGLGKAIADFDAGTALIEGRLGGENTTSILMRGADSLGLDAGSMGKIWQMARASGLDDPRDLLDFMQNIQLKTVEAETGEDPLMSQFAGKRGADLMTSVLGSLATLDPAQRAYFLDKLEGGERIGELNATLDKIQSLGIDANWLKLGAADADRGLAMHKEDALVSDYNRLKREAEDQAQASEIAAITQSTLKTWMQEQDRLNAVNISLLRRYEQNAQAAIPARELMEKVMVGISEKLLTLIGFAQATAEGVEGMSNAMEAQSTGAVSGQAMPMYLGGGAVPKMGG